MILTILIVVFVILLFLAAFLLVRTLTFPQVLPPIETVELAEVDTEHVAHALAAAVRCQTISSNDIANIPQAAFEELHKTLAEHYPLVHKTLKRQVIAGYSLLYTWQGSNPALDPLMFMAHQDVVPVEEQSLAEWQQPPFDGVIADGFLWGRGTLDIKCQMIGILETVENLLKEGFKPQRTIYLAFGHDEEVGGTNGARNIAAHLKEQDVRLAAVLDEGGMIMQEALPGVSAPVALVGIAEKGYLSLELSVASSPGHSSTPPRRTTIGRLARAISRLEANPLPAHIDRLRPMMQWTGPMVPFIMQLAFANLWLFKGLIKRKLEDSPQAIAVTRTTTAPTMISAGVKDNVLPMNASGVVNFRLIPGDSIAYVCDFVRKTIGDKEVTFKPYQDAAWEASPVSRTDTPGYFTLTDAIRQVFGDLPVAPYTVLGGTDARYYASLSEQVYRFSPIFATPEDMKRIHGNNERIAVEALGNMVRFFDLLVRHWSNETMN